MSCLTGLLLILRAIKALNKRLFKTGFKNLQNELIWFRQCTYYLFTVMLQETPLFCWLPFPFHHAGCFSASHCYISLFSFSSETLQHCCWAPKSMIDSRSSIYGNLNLILWNSPSIRIVFSYQYDFLVFCMEKMYTTPTNSTHAQ